jgi:DNA-binding transcriptional LysR family regulator
MDAETMRTFLSVARNRSISKAAQEMFATQPTVSLRIKRLEAELGFPVLTRSWRGVELTPQGRHILPTIADHLIRLQTATTMAQQEDAHSGTTSILNAHAAPATLAVDEWLVGEEISELLLALQDAGDVHLTVTNAARLHAMVAHGVCTRGIAYATPTPPAWDAPATTLWTETLAVVFPRGEDLDRSSSPESLREFFRSRRFILMDEPVFSDHASVTGPLLDVLAPAQTTVVDHTSIMASLCTLPGHATIVPAGLCSRKSAFAQDGLEWFLLDASWGTLPVVRIENGAEPLEAEQAIDRAITHWATVQTGQ